MNLADLVELFGAAAPWIVLLGVLFLASVIVAAFLQGREISIWTEDRFAPRSPVVLAGPAHPG